MAPVSELSLRDDVVGQIINLGGANSINPRADSRVPLLTLVAPTHIPGGSPGGYLAKELLTGGLEKDIQEC